MEGTSRTLPYTIRFVGLLGSHSLGRNPKFMATAVDLGRELIRRKIKLAYGGGSVGFQGAVASTVFTNGGLVRGFIPGYIATRWVYGPTYGVEHTVSSNYYKYFEMNHVVEAFIILPRGVDTMEAWESRRRRAAFTPPSPSPTSPGSLPRHTQWVRPNQGVAAANHPPPSRTPIRSILSLGSIGAVRAVGGCPGRWADCPGCWAGCVRPLGRLLWADREGLPERQRVEAVGLVRRIVGLIQWKLILFRQVQRA
ncbi:hypothetical protein DM860_016184 [Cuscuta australis]|uniref:Cytokinin riboside 5'-monophosphate phosphoribohydrolase n=1 Tax=Cuscuta australis TaxID=267555 RepID=A0A328DVB0_9ASTE|nr:hypothetical protein DM860_016184 [Cuscuta australis]